MRSGNVKQGQQAEPLIGEAVRLIAERISTGQERLK